MMNDNGGLLITAQLTAVSSAVVQRHTPCNWTARACGVWCETFAPEAAISQLPPNESCEMTEAFSARCNTKHFNFTMRHA